MSINNIINKSTEYLENKGINPSWYLEDERIYAWQLLTDFATELIAHTPTDAEIENEIRIHSTPKSEQWDIGFRSGAKWARSQIGSDKKLISIEIGNDENARAIFLNYDNGESVAVWCPVSVNGVYIISKEDCI